MGFFSAISLDFKNVQATRLGRVDRVSQSPDPRLQERLGQFPLALPRGNPHRVFYALPLSHPPSKLAQHRLEQGPSEAATDSQRYAAPFPVRGAAIRSKKLLPN